MPTDKRTQKTQKTRKQTRKRSPAASQPTLAEAARSLATSDAPEQLRQLRVAQSRIARLEAELQLERRKREQAETDLDDAHTWSSFLAQVSELETDVRISPPKRTKAGRAQTMPIICCCDWHVEQEIDPTTVNGVNEFNLPIAQRRVTNLWHKALYFINLWRQLADIREAVLWLGGDLISGTIHAELEETNQLGPVDATSLVVDYATAGIEYLLEHGQLERIHVITNGGNHGRTIQKPRHATAFQHSYESGAFLRIQDRTAHYKNVTWQISRAYHSYLTLYDRWRFRLHHGNAIRYQGGIGGISIPTHKAIGEWNKIRSVDCDIFGHWHSYLHEWNFVSCGSLVGFDPVAIAIKARDPPPTPTLVFLYRHQGKE
jgi:hypothetical protein